MTTVVLRCLCRAALCRGMLLSSRVTAGTSLVCENDGTQSGCYASIGDTGLWKV